MTDSGCKVSLCWDDNILTSAVQMLTHVQEYIANHWTVHLKWAHGRTCPSYFNKTIENADMTCVAKGGLPNPVPLPSAVRSVPGPLSSHFPLCPTKNPPPRTTHGTATSGFRESLLSSLGSRRSSEGPASECSLHSLHPALC